MRHSKMPNPFIGGNAKQRRKERRSGLTAKHGGGIATTVRSSNHQQLFTEHDEACVQ